MRAVAHVQAGETTGSIELQTELGLDHGFTGIRHFLH